MSRKLAPLAAPAWVFAEVGQPSERADPDLLCLVSASVSGIDQSCVKLRTFWGAISNGGYRYSEGDGAEVYHGPKQLNFRGLSFLYFIPFQ